MSTLKIIIAIMKSNYFFVEKYISKHRAIRSSCNLCITALQETKNSNLFDKKCTQENVKCHIQYEES